MARSAFWMRAAEAAVLAVAIYFSVGATDAGSRADSLGHRIMCTCGCSQLLGECDHYGCPSRGEEQSMLAASIGAGQSDQQIFDQFVTKYGATVLAAPTTKGFDLVAWIAPFAVFAAALMGTILLIRRWATPRGGAEALAATLPPAAPAEQERLDRIRRDTATEGGR
jgi:cytochrome c-type biogenesis protein CcmH